MGCGCRWRFIAKCKLSADDLRRGNEFWTAADLALEVVCPDNPSRDKKRKRKEYTESGIPEYWIVNPLDETMTDLQLDGTQYAEHGVFKRGDSATSALLEGFRVRIDAVFDAH